VKVGKEDILKLTIGNKSSYQISNGSGVKVVNSATSKNLAIKSNIHKYTCDETLGFGAM
jgi:hypothetical protein